MALTVAQSSRRPNFPGVIRAGIKRPGIKLGLVLKGPIRYSQDACSLCTAANWYLVPTQDVKVRKGTGWSHGLTEPDFCRQH